MNKTIRLHLDCAAANSLGDLRQASDDNVVDVVVEVNDDWGEQVTWLEGLPRVIGERISRALKMADH